MNYSTNDMGNTQISLPLPNGKEMVFNLHPDNTLYCVTVLFENQIIFQEFCLDGWAERFMEATEWRK